MSRSRHYSRWTLAGRVLERATRGYLADAGPQVSASIAYRVIFALFPLAIVLTALLGIVLRTTGSQDDVVDAIVENIPLSADGQGEMRSLLLGATGTLGGLGFLGLIPLVWAASGLMGALRYALNRAWDVSQRRPYIQGKLFDLLFVVLAFVLVTLSLVLSIGTSILERYAADVVDELGIDASTVTWVFGRLAPFLLALVAVLAAYRILPATNPPLRHVLPAAAAVALALTVLQSLFGLYLAHVRDFNAVYGSLGAVIAFLYFVYLAANLFVLGAEVAAKTPRARRELDADDGKREENEDEPFSRQLWNAARSLVVRDDAAAEPNDRDERRRAA